MHVQYLPIVKPFIIDELGLEFIDRRIPIDGSVADAYVAWVDHVSKIFRDRLIDVRDVICRNDSVQNRRDYEQFRKALDSEPGLKYEEFVQSGRAMLKENDLDPSKPDLFFCVRDVSTREWVGGFSVSNIDIESDTEDGIHAGGIMLLGIPTHDDIVTTWVTAYRYILKTGLLMVDNRMLDLVEDQFLSDQGLRDMAASDPVIIGMLDRMADHFDVTGTLANTDQNILIRRRGV